MLYKTLSMSVQPDRLPQDCATAERLVAEAVFDHAPKMEACIRKPLRFELPGLLTEAEIKAARAKVLWTTSSAHTRVFYVCISPPRNVTTTLKR